MTNARAARSPRPSLLLPAALVVAALSACAGGQKVSQPLPVWPPPPDVGRIKFVRTITHEGALGAGGARTFGRALLRSETVTIVQPTGLALSPDEKLLYVVSPSAPRVQAIDFEGKTVKWAFAGDKAFIESPFGVATDAEGSVYVTEHGKGDVVVFQRDGGVRRFGGGKIDRASGLAIDRRRQLVYVVAGATGDSPNHRVEVFSQKGEHHRTIGKRGAGPGEFNFPTNAAVAADGTLFVVDMLNFRVQAFDPDGQLLGMFGQIGAGAPGLFDKAKGIAIDAFGNLYVSDSALAIVQVFNAKYQPLIAFGGRGDTPGFMYVPTAIAISSKNTIYVADFAGEAVHEYQLINTTAADSYEPPPDAKQKTETKPAGETKPQGASPAAPTPSATPSEKPQGG